MVQMTAERDLLIRKAGIGTPDACRDNVVVPGVAASLYVRMQLHGFARFQPGLPRARLIHGDQECKRRRFCEAVEVPPTEQIRVVATPGGALVLRVAHDAGSSMLVDGKSLHVLGLR